MPDADIMEKGMKDGPWISKKGVFPQKGVLCQSQNLHDFTLKRG